MVGLSFAGDVLAVFAGLRLAFSLRFDTVMRHLGRPVQRADDALEITTATFSF